MTPRFHPSIFAILAACLTLVAGCSNVRLQSPQQLAQELSKSAKGSVKRKCDRENSDATAYLECTRRNDANYDAWRREREQDTGTDKNTNNKTKDAQQ